MSVASKRRLEQGFPRLTHHEMDIIRKHELRQFRTTLPPWGKLPFLSRCRALQHRRADEPASSASVPHDFSRGFFAHGSLDLPVRAETCLQAVQERFGLDACSDADMPGFSKFSGPLRELGESHMFVKDDPFEPGIPRGLKFTYDDTCWKKYHGLCETRDAPILRRLIKFSGNLRREVSEDSWVKVHVEFKDNAGDDSSRTLLVYVAQHRGRDPSLAVFAACHMLDATTLQLSVEDGRFVFLTDAMVALHFLKEARELCRRTFLTKAWCSPLHVHDIPGFLYKVCVVGCGDPSQFYAASRKFNENARVAEGKTEQAAPERANMFQTGLASCFGGATSSDPVVVAAAVANATAARSNKKPSDDDGGRFTEEALDPDGSCDGEGDEPVVGDDGVGDEESVVDDDEVVCTVFANSSAAPAAVQFGSGAAASSSSVVPAPVRRSRPSGAPRVAQSMAWGEHLGCQFSVAKVWCAKTESFIGWGATCRLHCDRSDGPRACCKKTLNYGREQLSDDELETRLKRWLLLGLDVEPCHVTARSNHRDIATRAELGSGVAPEELDSALAAKWADWQAHHCPV